MAKSTTTLYINDNSIRLMVTRGKRITKLADVPLDTPLNDINTEDKEAELVAKIKLLFKSNKISARKVILGLSGLHCLTRPVTLPELPKAMLDEAITREARRVLPVPLEQLYISWQTVSASEGKIDAFMVATPRQIADTLIRILNKAGLKPYLMDIKPLALARLARETSAIIVDVQSREFDIIVMVNRIPQPIRTVPFPEESQSFPEKILIVKDELKRTIQFYNSNNPDNLIQPNAPLLVSGELADEPELYEHLAQELGYQVYPLTSPLKCLKQLDPSHHLVNVGLALKEFTREAGPLLPNFNTLPAPYLPQPISLNRIMVIPTAAVAVGLIVLLAMTIQDSAASIELAHTQLDSTTVLLQKKQVQKKDLVQSVAAAEQKLASTETTCTSFTNALNSFNANGEKLNGDLLATVDNQIDDFELNTIAHSGKYLTINGWAESEQEVLEYARKLDTTGRFSEITISSLSRESSDNTTDTMKYSLNIRLRE
ncbi:MAG: pilus assembly protein PilM [Dehalococcoidales bacterium]|nr:pilus assembly protein PilM [Dehalococcoidales bacterium]